MALLRIMTWNIQHGFTASDVYDPAGQARVMADAHADVICRPFRQGYLKVTTQENALGPRPKK